MSIPVRQKSFAAGELAEALHSQDEIDAYKKGVAKLRGFIVSKHGSAMNRPGLPYRGSTKSHTGKSRLIPFIHSELPDQTYELEVGEGYIRPLSGGVTIPDKHLVAGGAGTMIRSEDHGDTFATTGMQDPGGTIFGIAADDDLWVAVGDGGYFLWSLDGKTWTQGQATAYLYRDVIKAGTVWVAVGGSAAGYDRVATSPDGKVWTEGQTGGAGNIEWGAISVSGERIVAGGIIGGANYRMALSVNGAAAWTVKSMTALGGASLSVDAVDIIASGTSRVVMAGGLFITDFNYMAVVVSEDNGDTWSANRMPFGEGGYGRRLGTSPGGDLVLTSQPIITGVAAYASGDGGESWTAITDRTDAMGPIIWDGVGGFFLLFSGSADGKVFRYDPATGVWAEEATVGTDIRYAAALGPGADEPVHAGVPYLEADLPLIKYAQSGDTLYLWCPGYDTQILTRLSHTEWTISEEEFGAGRDVPPSLSWATAPNQGALGTGEYYEQWEYLCTFVVEGRETQPSRPLWIPASATPAVHHLGIINKTKTAKLSVVAGSRVQSVRFYKGKNGMFGQIGDIPARGGGGGAVTLIDDGIEPNFALEPPEARYGVAADGTKTFSEPFKFPAWTALTAYQVGDYVTRSGLVYRCSVAGISGLTGPNGGGSYLVDGATVDLARSQTLAVNDLVRYRGATLIVTGIGSAPNQTSASWANAISELGTTKVDGDITFLCVGVGEAVRWEFVGAVPQLGPEPACGAFFGERLAMGGALARPETVSLSALADYRRFDAGLTLADDDAMEITLGSRQREVVRWLAGVEKLLVGTNSGVYAVSGDGGPLTPYSRQAPQQSNVGCADIHPLVVGDYVLYIRVKGCGVRELSYDDNAKKHLGADLSLLSSHLFDGHTIVDWAWQEDPNSIIWLVRDDGVLLSLTYVVDLDVFAWAWHDTDGVVESICTVPEGEEDSVYLIVNRTIGGATKRYVERMASRKVTVAKEGIFLDSSLTFDGRNTGATTVTVTEIAGGGFGVAASVTVTASVAGTFVAGDVGNHIVLDPDGTPIRLAITGFTSGTAVTCEVIAPAVPVAYQAVATTSWARAVDVLEGLDHLAGKTVNALADGNVVEGLVVGDGTGGTTLGRVTLATPAALAHVGLPYESDIELLDVADDRIRGNVKAVASVRFEVEKSRGLQVGPDFDHLREWRQRSVADGYGAIPLFTGAVEVTVSDRTRVSGRAVLRQSQPLPVTILAVTREVEIDGK